MWIEETKELWYELKLERDLFVCYLGKINVFVERPIGRTIVFFAAVIVRTSHPFLRDFYFRSPFSSFLFLFLPSFSSVFHILPSYFCFSYFILYLITYILSSTINIYIFQLITCGGLLLLHSWTVSNTKKHSWRYIII